MKLASLAYEICRDAIEVPSGFNKDGFVRGDYDHDREYSPQISFAFHYINLALARLATGKKTVLKIADKISNDTGYIEFKDGDVISVLSDLGPEYKRVRYANYMEGVAVEADYVQKVVYIEYRPAIPHFDIESIRDQTVNDDNEEEIVEVDVELSDYGVTDEMCNYVKEYAKGGLMEYLSPDLSQKHTQMAETYFSSLKTRYTEFPQHRVANLFGAGGAF